MVLALFAWLGRLELLNPDEARHAEIAREMLAGGSWLVPHIHGEPYYDKPVLFHWMLAASMAAFGTGTWAARLPVALAALLALAATGWWSAGQWGRRTGIRALLVLATMPMFVAIGRHVISDMVLTATLSIGFFWLGAWLTDAGERRRSIYPFYMALGVGCLVKGPVAFVLGGAMGVTAVGLAGERSMLGALRPVRGTLLAIAVAAPWYLAAWWFHPEYIETFLFVHNFERFAVPGTLTHQEPLLYYIYALPIGLLPWSPALLVALARPAKSGDLTRRFLLAWVAIVVGFFSLSSTKLLTYALPALPPLAALLAQALEEPSAALRNALRWTAYAWVALVAVASVGAGAAVAWSRPDLAGRALLALPAVAVAVVTLRGSGASGAGITSKEGCDLASGPGTGHIMAASVALFIAVFGLAADAVNVHQGQIDAARIATAPEYRNLPILSHRVEPHALAFYAGRMAQRSISTEQAIARLSDPHPMLLLTKSKRLAELGLAPLPETFTTLWTAPDGTMLIAKQPVS